jgi:hypothetical protein
LEELKSIAISAQITNPQPQSFEEDGIPHTITQEDLDNNPDLVEQGLKVGDKVLLDEPTLAPAEKDNSSSKRGLKKS